MHRGNNDQIKIHSLQNYHSRMRSLKKTHFERTKTKFTISRAILYSVLLGRKKIVKISKDV